MYTHEDFLKAMRESGLEGKFSDADLKLAQVNPDAGMGILTAKKDYYNATTQEAKQLAHAQVEKIRSANGYYGGADGSGYIPETGAAAQQAQINQLIAAMTQPKPQYNQDTDPGFQAYAKQYAREGQRATADTMGTLAGATGGIPSSYAATAAAQAGNYYAAQMADKIPELMQLFQENHRADMGQNMNLLSLLLSQQSSQQQMDYNREMADREYDFSREQFEAQREDAAWSKALQEAQAAAALGDYSKINALLGIAAQQTAGGTVGSSGGSTGSYTGSSSDGTAATKQQNISNFFAATQDYAKQLVADAAKNGTTQTSGTAANKAKAAQAQQRADTNGGVIANQADYNAMVAVYGKQAVDAAYTLQPQKTTQQKILDRLK